MIIPEKIKQVRHEFYDGVGPAETTTLGIKYGDRSYILGTYYIGPYCNKGSEEEKKKTELFIDNICFGLEELYND